MTQIHASGSRRFYLDEDGALVEDHFILNGALGARWLEARNLVFPRKKGDRNVSTSSSVGDNGGGGASISEDSGATRAGEQGHVPGTRDESSGSSSSWGGAKG